LVEKALNHLAKKLSGVEGEEKDKLRVIHDLAANGLVAKPCVINEKAQWFGENGYAFRRGEEQARYNTEKRRGQMS
jgi:hypothetical protein